MKEDFSKFVVFWVLIRKKEFKEEGCMYYTELTRSERKTVQQRKCKIHREVRMWG